MKHGKVIMLSSVYKCRSQEFTSKNGICGRGMKVTTPCNSKAKKEL